MKYLALLAGISMAGAFSAHAGPNKKTYFLEVTGDAVLAEKLVTELTQKNCYTLSDVQATVAQYKNSECHNFKKLENEKQVKQSFKVSEGTYLYKIALAPAEKKYNLQIFKRDLGKIRRIVNAGDFTAKADFYGELSHHTVALTFK